MAKSEFLQIFKERGFFHQCTNEKGLDNLLSSKKNLPVYIGFDCTATSLHIGSLIQIMILRWLQKTGHKPIVLLGGATTKVGDPSGKDEARKLLSEEEIQKNLQGIKSLISKFVDFEDRYNTNTSKAFLVNNDEWFDGLGYISLLRDVGRYFSVNKMLSFESVKMRLEREETFSFLEFNYMIMQAYDFVELHKKYECRLQIGGSDQWGNIVNGIELRRKMRSEKRMAQKKNDEDAVKSGMDILAKEQMEYGLFGLTTPLITTASGAKMGKTVAGAVWLSEDLVSAYDYWQFWRNSADKDVERFLRLFTELPIEDIEKLGKLEGANINKAKIILANEVTKICHGETASKEAEETARKVFEQGNTGDLLPVITIERKELEVGVAAFKLLNQTGLAESGKAAKRLIQQGAAKLNDDKIMDEMALINTSHLNSEGIIKISSSKKKHALVKVI